MNKWQTANNFTGFHDEVPVLVVLGHEKWHIKSLLQMVPTPIIATIQSGMIWASNIYSMWNYRY
ncbi:hypothetical protein Kalk_03580 [Ketobacter alkanivorans]|uniref:Uncharacterized protein n=1 Tax=Ketobacter alkanivorans TaxID=1917421 RepID=A0A2K9LHC3_9GAMM|nr:hypothetical protein Kalk_03580 [Ketobacter alkanivorans]